MGLHQNGKLVLFERYHYGEEKARQSLRKKKIYPQTVHLLKDISGIYKEFSKHDGKKINNPIK